MDRTSHLLAVVVLIGAAALSTDGTAYGKELDPLRAGAFAIDITPEKLPVIVSGGFLEGKSGKVRDHLAIGGTQNTKATGRRFCVWLGRLEIMEKSSGRWYIGFDVSVHGCCNMD